MNRSSSSTLRRLVWLSLITAVAALPTQASELTVSLRGAPDSGRLFFQVYDDADAFGSFRDPAYTTSLAAAGDGEYRLSGIPTGEIALLVFFDENGNDVLDKNFIGIPREPIGLSRGYRPKGPPSFERASFEFTDEDSEILEIELFQILGKRGQFGVGLGVIGRGSPYVDSDRSVTRVIPAVTYIGERLQWLGPDLSYGFLGSNKLRLAVTANYRIGPYEEDDSPRLVGLGDRENTLMVGLGLDYELPAGFEAELGFQHDVLDRIGGAVAFAELSRGFQLGTARLTPALTFNWASREVSNHDYGVSTEAQTAERTGYSLGSTTSVSAGLQGFFELSERWRVIVTANGEFLDSEVKDSPIVEDDTVISGFAAIAYAF